MNHPLDLTRTLSVMALLASGTAQAVDFQLKDTQASLYGYAKLDIIHDLDADLGNFVDRNKIRLDGEKGPDGHTNLHAFQSRLGIRTLTPTPRGDLAVNVEETFTAAAAATCACATLTVNGTASPPARPGVILAVISPCTPPLISPPGRAWPMQAGRPSFVTARVVFPLPWKIRATWAGMYPLPPRPKQEWPAGSDPALSEPVWPLAYGASTVLRQLEYYRDSTDSDETVLGWGLSLEARYQQGDVTLRGALTHGDGIGGYLEGSPSRPGYVDPASGELETIEASGATAGITMQAGPGAVTLGYGIARSDIDEAVHAGALNTDSTKQFEAIHLNYIWSPITAVSYGIEVSHHTREVQDGREGDATRLQGMVMYRF
ncbi:hypothetical protein MBH78_14370 [Oceanimonas sp. NS1]|nr:hypothetical protein [Oceanimonas sp. NS1]